MDSVSGCEAYCMKKNRRKTLQALYEPITRKRKQKKNEKTQENCKESRKSVKKMRENTRKYQRIKEN